MVLELVGVGHLNLCAELYLYLGTAILFCISQYICTVDVICFFATAVPSAYGSISMDIKICSHYVWPVSSIVNLAIIGQSVVGSTTLPSVAQCHH